MQKLFLFLMCVMLNSMLYGMESEDKQRELKWANRALFEKLMWDQRKLTRIDQVWDKNDSACAWADIWKKDKASLVESGPRKLELTLVKLNENKCIVIKSKTFDGYKKPVITTFDDNPRIFFDQQGGIFCHGIGDVWGSYGTNYENSLCEYSMNGDGKKNIKRCQILVNKYESIPFSALLNFPALMQAFLSSTKIKDDPQHGFSITIKEYKVEGVTIPDNYKEYKKHPLGDSYVSSYDKLDGFIRKTIEDRLAQQQREKNSNTIQEK